MVKWLSLLIMNKKGLLLLLETWDTVAMLKSDSDGNTAYLPDLMDIALTGNDRLSWRAAWVAEKINERQPGILSPWIGQVTGALHHLNHSGKKRQFLKLISLYPIAQEHRAFLVDYCLETLDKRTDPPGVKAHAMQIMYNISQDEPGLKEELLQIMEYVIELEESAGITARARRIAGQLAREIRTLHRR
jgi:hypothetical protein